MSISAAQLTNLRNRASAIVESVFETTLTIPTHDPFKAARWSRSKTATPELAGLFQGCDIVFRIQRVNIPAGVTITPEKTKIVEDSITYRVERIQDANGDPAILVGCKAV